MDAMFFQGTVQCIRGFLVLDPKRVHGDMNRRPYAETFRRRAHPMCRFCDNGALTVVRWKPSKLEAAEWLA